MAKMSARSLLHDSFSPSSIIRRSMVVGLIYVLLFSVAVASDNLPPVGDAGGPYMGIVGNPIFFDASNSYDPDGEIITYIWDFGDGSTRPCQPKPTGINFTHAYNMEGTYTVILTVYDAEGGGDEVTTTATISPSNYETISIHEAKDLIDSTPTLAIIDVRGPEEYNTNHLKGAINIPLDQLEQRLEELDKNKPTLIYCRSGYKSAQASYILDGNNFETYDMAGGLNEWINAGYPTVEPNQPPMADFSYSPLDPRTTSNVLFEDASIDLDGIVVS